MADSASSGTSSDTFNQWANQRYYRNPDKGDYDDPALKGPSGFYRTSVLEDDFSVSPVSPKGDDVGNGRRWLFAHERDQKKKALLKAKKDHSSSDTPAS